MGKERKIEGDISSSGVRTFIQQRKKGGEIIGASRIQKIAIQKAFELLGDEVWVYGFKSGRRSNNMKGLISHVRNTCGYEGLSVQTFRCWIQHYIQYGKIPAETKSYAMKRHNRRPFSTGENNILLNILESSPQFYLDEIANELYDETGKR